VTISTLLVANRGEIARRVIRTARAMGLRTVAIYVDADARSPYVDDADVAVRIETGYLDAAAILTAARDVGADAIHPGYGFLSENAAFAEAVESAGLTWVGPSPASIASMGDKLSAKELAIAAGVPTLPHATDPADAHQVGYPLLVKASAGGGGKGMRVVNSPEDLDEAVAAARREALGGFGDDTVFLERYVARSRHVEIQILGDRHGNVVHLGERECSIQRRHQKLVEESPSPVVDDEMRKHMGAAAVALAREIGYYSTGTVEFLVDDETRHFYFLEVNTRLQVEHPVTEEVTGRDLVADQLRVAAGEPLGFHQSDVSWRGHAIEVRLCAEDPASGFLPATGRLAAFTTPELEGVRWESGVAEGSDVAVAFDPLLAKVIAHGETREIAARRLARALEQLHLGGVTTNRDFLVATLRHDSFLAGDTTTDFIERCEPARTLELSENERHFALAAAAMWLRGENRRVAPVLASAPANWRNARLPDEYVELRLGGEVETISYRTLRDGTVRLGELTVRVADHGPRHVDVEYAGVRRRCQITRSGDHLYVQLSRGTVTIDVLPRFSPPAVELLSGSLSAPMPGTILDVRVAVGDVVTKSTTLVVMEAMKMEHHIAAPYDGQVVDILVEPGQQVDNGAVLLVIDETEAPE
jgi:propionyl-CoA carboxylase alpha chain